MMALIVPNLNMSWGVAPQINPQDMLSGFTGLPKAIAEFRVRKGIDAAHAVGETPSDTLLRFADSQGIGTGYLPVAQREALEAKAAQEAEEAGARQANMDFERVMNASSTRGLRGNLNSAQNNLMSFERQYPDWQLDPDLTAMHDNLTNTVSAAQDEYASAGDTFASAAPGLIDNKYLSEPQKEVLRARQAALSGGTSGRGAEMPYEQRESELGGIDSLVKGWSKSTSPSSDTELGQLLKDNGLTNDRTNREYIRKQLGAKSNDVAAERDRKAKETLQGLGIASASEQLQAQKLAHIDQKFTSKDKRNEYLAQTENVKSAYQKSLDAAASGQPVDKLAWIKAYQGKFKEDGELGSLGNQILNAVATLVQKERIENTDLKILNETFDVMQKQARSQLNRRMGTLEGE